MSTTPTKRKKSWLDWIFGGIAGLTLLGPTAIVGMFGVSTLLTAIGGTALPVIGSGIGAGLGFFGLGAAGSAASAAIAGSGAAVVAAGGVVSSTASFLMAPIIGGLSTATAFLSGLPLIGPVFMTAGLAFPPFGIVIAGILAAPAILGAVYEAYRHFIESFKSVFSRYDSDHPLRSFGVIAVQIIATFVAIPFNLVSGFFRTAINMFRKDCGYTGAFAETRAAVERETKFQRQSTLLGASFSNVWDHILIGPVTGIVSGFVGSLEMMARAIKDAPAKGFLKTLGNFTLGLCMIVAGPIVGLVRGVVSGYAGFDTREHLVKTFSLSKTEKDARIKEFKDEIEKAPTYDKDDCDSAYIAKQFGNTHLWGNSRYLMADKTGEAFADLERAAELEKKVADMRTDPNTGQPIINKKTGQPLSPYDPHPINTKAKKYTTEAERLKTRSASKEPDVLAMKSLRK